MRIDSTDRWQLRSFPWLKDADELDPSTFTWEMSEMDNSFICHHNAKGEVILPENWVVIGWTDAEKLRVRPRSGQIAVMFEEEDKDEDTIRRFWLHIIL